VKAKKKLEKPHTFFKFFNGFFSILKAQILQASGCRNTSVTLCNYIIGIAWSYFSEIFCFWRKNWMRAEEREVPWKTGAINSQ